MYFTICILPTILLAIAIGSIVICFAYFITAYAAKDLNIKAVVVSLSTAIAIAAVLVLGGYNYEVLWPSEYDVARMAENYNANVRTGSRERLIHYHWFGDYWVYNVESPEPNPYAEYAITTSERN